MPEESKNNPSPELGVSNAEFEATVETLRELCAEGKYQVFLSRHYALKFVGNADELAIGVSKRMGKDTVDRERQEECLQEARMYLQTRVYAASVTQAARILETQFYDDNLEEAGNNEELKEAFGRIIRQKLEQISTKFPVDSLKRRAKRLATAVGPLLEDVDFDIISRRVSASTNVDLEGPFLRMKLRHSIGGKSPFYQPPWYTGRVSDLFSFDFDCDEADIDFLIKKLLQAKELLSGAVRAKVEPIEPKGEKE
jgi:hypothetical protein